MATEVEEIARRKSGDEGDDEGADDDKEMSSYDDVEENAANELCEALGVDEGKRDDVKSALRDYVKACVEKALGDEDDEE